MSVTRLKKVCPTLTKTYEKLDIASNKDICKRYNMEAKRPRPVFECPYSHLNKYPKYGITMVVTVTKDRFDVFEYAIKYWNGPVSVALYVDCDEDFATLLNRTYNWLKFPAIDVHIVLGTGVCI